jgi:hypothetical protein
MVFLYDGQIINRGNANWQHGGHYAARLAYA